MEAVKFIEQIESFLPRCEREQQEKRVMLDWIRQFPHNILTRENEFAHMTSSGFIMNEKLDKVLFIYHKIYDAWTWTGGHSDGEQDLLSTAVREAREETGLQRLRPLTKHMLSLDIIPVYGHMKKERYVSPHLHLNAAYVLLADERDRLEASVDEASGITWIPVDEIGEYSKEPYLMDIYQKLIDRARKI